MDDTECVGMNRDRDRSNRVYTYPYLYLQYAFIHVLHNIVRYGIRRGGKYIAVVHVTYSVYSWCYDRYEVV